MAGTYAASSFRMPTDAPSQELELNQFTFTPELRLHMAKVIVPGEEDLLVHQYSRPIEQQEAYAPGEDARTDIFDLDWAEIVSAEGRRKLRFYRL